MGVADGQGVPLGNLLESAFRKRASLQEGCKLRRYKRRWKVERTISWVGNFRRLVVRWDRSS